MKKSLPLSTLLLISLLAVSDSPISNGQDDLRQRLDDRNGMGEDFWIYNDLREAREVAIRENKPMFVTFRCVPCKACNAFDAEVARGSEKIRKLAKQKFVAVRQVEMKNVDLSLFEFDHDLNWAAMFINPDGTVYARYGTQSAEGPDAYNSIDGLLKTMERVLEIHHAYPGNKEQLAGKRRSQKPRYALELPGLKNAEKLAKVTTRSNCIHCHTIHDSAHFDAQASGRFDQDMLWKYPLPDNVGLLMDRVEGNQIQSVIQGSAAEKSGLKSGDRIGSINGQIITSIADIQWVLHHLENGDQTIAVKTATGARHRVSVRKGWKKYDISWRGSMWSVSPMLRVWAPTLASDRLKALHIEDPQTAFLVKWINRGSKGGRSAFDSGLRQQDIIVELEGKPIEKLTPQQFNAYIKLNYKVGDKLPLTVLRKGKKQKIEIRLVE